MVRKFLNKHKLGKYFTVFLRFHKNHRVLIYWVVLHLFVTGLLAYKFTDFRSANEALAAISWGAGTPSSSYITAFATLSPWWYEYQPETIQVKDDESGIEPLVKINRVSVFNTHNKLLPSRSIGYYAILGLLTMFRSIFSDNAIVYDYAFLIRCQQMFLILSYMLLPLVLYFAFPLFRNKTFFLFFNVVFYLILLIFPNEQRFLIEGIIDSSLAAPVAILSVSAWILIVRNVGFVLPLPRYSLLQLFLSALLLSGFCLIRGEFLFIFMIVLVFLLIFSLVHVFPQVQKRIIVTFFLLLSIPLFYGITNKILFDSFTPLRMQSGQNLFEPIGQFPNPWGIQYSDYWLREEYLSSRGLEYLSFETDRYLTMQYLKLLFENPKLFWRNFESRLDIFSEQLVLSINEWKLNLKYYIWLTLIIFYLFAQQRSVMVYIPHLIAVAYLIFFAWTNSLFRLVAPVHFLIQVAFLFSVLYLLYQCDVPNKFLRYVAKASC